jgi:hypothetical protein
MKIQSKNLIILTIALVAIVIISIVLVLALSDGEKPLTAQEMLDLGDKFLLELNYEQALVQFLRVIEIEPMNPRGYIGAAEAYLGLEQEDKAIEILELGYERTSDEEIKRMLDELTAEPNSDSNPEPTPDSNSEPAPAPQPEELSDEDLETLAEFVSRVSDRTLTIDFPIFNDINDVPLPSLLALMDMQMDWQLGVEYTTEQMQALGVHPNSASGYSIDVAERFIKESINANFSISNFNYMSALESRSIYTYIWDNENEMMVLWMPPMGFAGIWSGTFEITDIYKNEDRYYVYTTGIRESGWESSEPYRAEYFVHIFEKNTNGIFNIVSKQEYNGETPAWLAAVEDLLSVYPISNFNVNDSIALYDTNGNGERDVIIAKNNDTNNVTVVCISTGAVTNENIDVSHIDFHVLRDEWSSYRILFQIYDFFHEHF